MARQRLSLLQDVLKHPTPVASYGESISDSQGLPSFMRGNAQLAVTRIAARATISTTLCYLILPAFLFCDRQSRPAAAHDSLEAIIAFIGCMHPCCPMYMLSLHFMQCACIRRRRYTNKSHSAMPIPVAQCCRVSNAAIVNPNAAIVNPNAGPSKITKAPEYIARSSLSHLARDSPPFHDHLPTSINARRILAEQ